MQQDNQKDTQKTIQAGIAKAGFRDLLNRGESGETIVIERYGKPAAVITPVRPQSEQRPNPKK